MAKSGMSEKDVDSEEGTGEGANSQQEETKAESKCEEKSSEITDDWMADAVCVINKSLKTSTYSSILIESLVKNLCHLYEPNADNASRTYKFICENLHRMQLIDESYKMNEFEGIRNQYQRALHQLLTTANGGQSNLIHPVWPNVDVTNEWSHYYREFDEIEFIAGGGFGKVYRVKHKLDGTEYAIKKIYIRSEGIKSVRNYLSEVKTFASLNHSNIVQYKAAWLEVGADTGKGIITEHTSDSDYTYPTDTITTEEEIHKTNTVDTFIYPNLISDVESSFKDVHEGSTDFEVSFESSIQVCQRSCSSRLLQRSRRQQREKRNSISEGGNAICTIEEIQNMKIQSRPRPRWATLYIQMTLCQSTLKQWLDNRNSSEAPAENEAALVPVGGGVRTNTIMEILKQLLQGLEYIHSKNIVHHDIKPSNIFLQIENGGLQVQLGDFGLACPLQSARHTLGLGTKTYAAPEQLNGICDSKSDMYSLGIVVLELAETYQTDMERIHSISQLRKGNLPDHITIQHPQLAVMIHQLMLPRPNDRPDATSLLKRITVDDVESQTIQDLRCQIVEKEQEIKRLKALLESASISKE